MNILAFDTSTTSGSIAFVSDGQVIGELNVPDVGTHGE